MKFRIFHGGKSVFNKKGFDTPNYECIATFYTKKEQPVTLCRHKENNIWKVQYGFYTLVFDSYTKAMDYCKSRFTINPARNYPGKRAYNYALGQKTGEMPQSRY